VGEQKKGLSGRKVLIGALFFAAVGLIIGWIIGVIYMTK